MTSPHAVWVLVDILEAKHDPNVRPEIEQVCECVLLLMITVDHIVKRSVRHHTAQVLAISPRKHPINSSITRYLLQYHSLLELLDLLVELSQ